MNKLLDWLVNHSNNAEELEYWISYNVLERTLKHCLETGIVEEI